MSIPMFVTRWRNHYSGYKDTRGWNNFQSSHGIIPKLNGKMGSYEFFYTFVLKRK